MRQQAILWATLVIAVAACSSKKDEAAPKAAASAPAGEHTPGKIAQRTLDGLRGDGHAEFAMSEKQIVKACTDLSTGMTRFVAQLEKETEKLNAGMGNEDHTAPRKFGEFLQRSTAALLKVKADGDLGAARDELVAAIQEMGAAYIAFAKAWDEHQDTEPAQNKMLEASEKMQAAFVKLADVCTG